jgi:hypothetical protein
VELRAVSAKTYDKKCARLVQEAMGIPYTMALKAVRAHEEAFPERMPAETRALAILDARGVE